MGTAELWCVRAGLLDYADALALQDRVAAARRAGSAPDALLLLEHAPVYTRGRRSTPAELPMGVDWYRLQGIDVVDTDRGGRVTYHGPGQLVAYPIISLRPYRDDVHGYVRRLEQVIAATLARYGIAVRPPSGLTGVWTADGRKIASIGVHVSRGVTTHGFAVNVSNDLQPFQWIVPCGIEDCPTTSVTREIGTRAEMGEFMDAVCAEFEAAFGRRAREVPFDGLRQAAEGSATVGARALEAPA